MQFYKGRPIEILQVGTRTTDIRDANDNEGNYILDNLSEAGYTVARK
jgi:hypothetical protein